MKTTVIGFVILAFVLAVIAMFLPTGHEDPTNDFGLLRVEYEKDYENNNTDAEIVKPLKIIQPNLKVNESNTLVEAIELDYQFGWLNFFDDMNCGDD